MKLGPIKYSVKAMNRNGESPQCYILMFPWISDAKIRERFFFGPQIKEVVSERNSD
jgi:hypothetical protein